MKKTMVIILTLFILFSSYSCIFFSNEPFKETINHELVFAKLLCKNFYPNGMHYPSIFDGNYFYFGAATSTGSTQKASVMKVDLDGNLIWNTVFIDEAKNLGFNSMAQSVISIKKASNKLFIMTGDSTIDLHHHELHIIDADTGHYYGLYYLNEDNDCFDQLAPDEYNKVVYVPLSIYKIFDPVYENQYDFHIYCFNVDTNELIYERIFENTCITLSGSGFIHNGKMYFRTEVNKILFILDCAKVADPTFSDEQCIIKDIPVTDAFGACTNILVVNNKIITGADDASGNPHFICLDEANNYTKLWETEGLYDGNLEYTADVDMIAVNDRFIFPRYRGYVSCNSLVDGRRLWVKDNTILSQDVSSTSNHMSIGAVIQDRWYAQPVTSDSTVIIYEISSGKKAGRLEGIYTSVGDNQCCFAVGNKLYIVTWIGYLYCYEITSKSNLMIIITIIIGGGTFIGLLAYFIGKRKYKKSGKEALKEKMQVKGNKESEKNMDKLIAGCIF